MHLTRYSDYAMRVLLYLGARPERQCSIAEVAKAYGISQSHLMKVVSDLVQAGYVASVRGRTGGIRLGMPPERIVIGELVRRTEGSLALVDCASCLMAPGCGLACVLGDAMDAFLAVLDRHTLADVIARRPEALGRLVGEPFR